MSTARRYAWLTTVPVEQSRAEMMTLLAKHEVRKLATTHDSDTGDGIQFVLGDRQYRFFIPKPRAQEVERMGYDSLYWKGGQTWTLAIDAEWRRRWRAMLMLWKVKLDAIAAGDATLDAEFLAYAVMADGRTLLQAAAGNGLNLLGAGK